MFSRLFFPVDTDTGHQVIVSAPFSGAVHQMHWNPDVGDTGGDLTVSLLPKSGDTGDGFQIYSEVDCLGSDFTRAPRQAQHGPDGSIDPADTGAAFGVPVVAAGDRLQVKVTPGGSSVSGRLYVWTYE